MSALFLGYFESDIQKTKFKNKPLSLFKKAKELCKEDSYDFRKLTFQNMIEFLQLCVKHGLTVSSMSSSFLFYKSQL